MEGEGWGQEGKGRGEREGKGCNPPNVESWIRHCLYQVSLNSVHQVVHYRDIASRVIGVGVQKTTDGQPAGRLDKGRTAEKPNASPADFWRRQKITQCIIRCEINDTTNQNSKAMSRLPLQAPVILEPPLKSGHGAHFQSSAFLYHRFDKPTVESRVWQ